MGLNLAALNSEFNSDFIPKTVSDFLSDLSAIQDVSEKVEKLNDFVHKLEDETKKIQVFQREFPLSMLLLRDAIAKLKEETMRCEERMESNLDEEGGVKGSIDNNDKKNWMSSVQLWTSSTEHNNSDHVDSMGNMTKNRAGGLVLPIRQENQVFGKIGENSSRKIEMHKNQRKQRRCWSPELHRRFISALQQLGGPQVATPKQIRELMRVQDLTNDEIKSHLQKYRLHVRKIIPTKSGAISDSFSWLGKSKLFSQVSNPKTAQSWSPDGPIHNLSGSSANRGVSMSLGDREYESMARISSASQSH